MTEDLSSISPHHLVSDTPNDFLNLRKGPGLNFEIVDVMPDQTLLEPVELKENWIFVHKLGTSFQPIKSGWVHRRYTRPT